MRVVEDKDFKAMCISGISVTSGVRPKGRTTDNRKKARHRNGLLFIWNGEAVFWQNGKRVASVGQGGLLFIPKGTMYKMQYNIDNTTFVLVDFDMFDRNGEDITFFDRITEVACDDESHRIASVMSKLEITGSSQSPAAELRKKELLYRLLSLVLEQGFPLFVEQQRYPRIFKGVMLLKQSYLENIPITRFAESCNISVSSFRELFRKQYGMSPLQYRNRLRLERAKQMLTEGGCTVAEAAYASGFENIGYFCRCYKAVMGETPTKSKI